ncbi:hypothetical protein ADK67_28090 [Saccharothrix sp. NRRL B-16348]|nr:hypothetical protein ADK67_28090 [Saccharothrix sp. NRRL B-16348]
MDGTDGSLPAVVSSRFAGEAVCAASSAAVTQPLTTCTVNPRSVACRAVCSTVRLVATPVRNSVSTPWSDSQGGQVVPGEAGELRVVDHGHRAAGHLGDQPRAGGVGPERLLRSVLLGC